ncbi:MAG: hypothetical protein ACLSFT_04930 [Ruminococcus callidus]
METTKNKPLASPKEDTLVGNGMSKREARKIRMQSMNKSEIAYMRRKRVFDAVWPFFRFFILFDFARHSLSADLHDQLCIPRFCGHE